MARFIEEVSRAQISLLPQNQDEFAIKDNPTHVIEASVERLDWLLWSSMGPLLPQPGAGPSPYGTVEGQHPELSQPHFIQPTPGARTLA